MKILVINAGSSSLKYQLISMTKRSVMARGVCERIGISDSRLKRKTNGGEVIVKSEMKTHADAIRLVLSVLTDKDEGVIKSMDEIRAIGHRVVHGGEFFADSVIIDDDVKKAIELCSELAPLHNPPNLTGILACEKAMPGVLQVAVFDTAFHQTMPSEAYMYALPYEYYEKYKIRKYGFHGTSHKYVARRAAELLNRPLEDLKLITCHLGNGSSIAAIQNGKSIDTSMGFTPLAGVVMGTRCGTIDPAIVTFLMEKEGKSYREINDVLNKRSGVLGLSGVSSDFRDLDAAIANGNKRAALAVSKFVYSVRQFVGAYLSLMNGADAIVFTAGVGENNPDFRRDVINGLRFMGAGIDEEKNLLRGVEADVSSEGACVRTLLIPTNEELMIALDTQRLVMSRE